MSSLARGLRTTAAAAGIAALGAGLAAPALAAPQAPALPGPDALEAPAAPEVGELEGMLAELGESPSVGAAELPEPFAFELPSADVLDMESPTALRTAELPEGAGPESFAPVVNVGPDSETGGVPEMPSFTMPDVQVGPPPAGDTSAIAGELMSGASEGVSGPLG
ncbi:MAG TPA: hypothetical protein VM367_18670 [Pseudonocardia sp.]|jgi:hypothetical protein|nr:hypothetical protein [Pseudonocardia sp.]